MNRKTLGKMGVKRRHTIHVPEERDRKMKEKIALIEDSIGEALPINRLINRLIEQWLSRPFTTICPGDFKGL
jgi:hypothetical protein